MNQDMVQLYLNQLILTSVVGSNIFFNSKLSLGVPTGSATVVGISCVGRAGAGIIPGLPIGKLIACWAGADPFTMGGTPMLQCFELSKVMDKYTEYKRKKILYLAAMPERSSFCISNALDWAFKACREKSTRNEQDTHCSIAVAAVFANTSQQNY